jgi:transposase InsO family protein
VSVSGLCRLAGISRQAYYQERRARGRKGCQEQRLLASVRQERMLQPRIGARKLQVLLAQAGLAVGRDRLFALLGRSGLLVPPKKKAVRTTWYDQSLPVYRNLLYNLEPTGPHQVWVADITHVATEEGFVHLALITDLVSRAIVGWNVGETNEALKALHMAKAQLPPECYPIHRSDRGSQYCCHEYVAVLQSRSLPVSMTEQNHCYENSYAERVNGILKDEFNLDRRFRTREQARRAIAQSIGTYNSRRPHLSLQMRTPNQVHRPAA